MRLKSQEGEEKRGARHPEASGYGGRAVLALESRHSVSMGEEIMEFGGVPVLAPTMQEIPLENNPELVRFGELLTQGKVDVVIFMTGVGAQIVFGELHKKFVRDLISRSLQKITVVARGPKPLEVLRDEGLRADLIVPDPSTWFEIIETLDTEPEGLSLKDKTVAVQEYGVPNERLIHELKKRGAKVIQVPVYRWALPTVREPIYRALEDLLAGEIDVSVFTNAEQIRHALRVAAERGMETEVINALKKTIVASVGPNCSAALREAGVPVDFEPSHPTMHALVSECAIQCETLIREKHGKPSFVLSVREKDIAAGRQERLDTPFMRACRRESVPYTPVWLMRQAGRYMKEYRAIRNKMGFLELCKRPEVCAEVTVFAQERIGADAAIIFSDLLVPVEPMGLGLEYTRGGGPQITGQVSTIKGIESLRDFEPEEALSYVMDAIRTTRRALRPEIPLIGFAGAPFTLASYMIEGGASRLFRKTKLLMLSDAKAWQLLMNKICSVLIRYLNAQADAGADVLQIFDSWVGCLSPEDYRRHVLPFTRKVIDGLKPGVPVIHFGTGTAGFLGDLREAGGDVIGVDYRIRLDHAWNIIGRDKAVQGNMDPVLLQGPLKEIFRQADMILDQAGDTPSHIFNLGHGILPETPVDHVKALVDYVHEKSSRRGKLK